MQKFRTTLTLLLSTTWLITISCSSSADSENGGNSPEIPASEFNIKAFATKAATCPDDNSPQFDAEPGDEILLCYRVENSGERTLERHRIFDTTFGLVVEESEAIRPGESRIFSDRNGRRVVENHSVSIVDYTVSSGNATGTRRTGFRVLIAPHITLYRLFAESPDRCSEGVGMFFPPKLISGYRQMTVAPGTPVTQCFTLHHSSKSNQGTAPVLNNHSLSDSDLGAIMSENTTELDVLTRFLTVARMLNAPSSNREYEAEWRTRAGWADPNDFSQKSRNMTVKAHSTLHISENPACTGIIEHTTFDYVAGATNLQSGFRLDFEVEANSASAGNSVQIEAVGYISTLQPAESFGPRDDTRILLPIPDGLDISSLSVNGTITGGVTLNTSIDTGNGLIRLSTGPVTGLPAEVFLTINATPNGTVNPVLWSAPELEMEFIGDQGNRFVQNLRPDPDGPPVLRLPLCDG